MSLAPTSTSVSAGYFTAYVPTFLETLDSSALMNALPSTPAPGDSYRPRAKTTCPCGQFAAAADGAAPGVPNGRIAAVNISAAAIAIAANPTSIDIRAGERRTSTMLRGSRSGRWTGSKIRAGLTPQLRIPGRPVLARPRCRSYRADR